MATTAVIPVLVTFMLISGVANTLITKYQDNVCVRNCDDPDPLNRELFAQPVIQSAQMFIGEMGCWLIVGLFSIYRRYIQRSPQDSGYQAVNGREEDVHNESSLPDYAPTDPLAKVLTANTDERISLEGWRICFLALPAICDLTGTSLMNVGLLFVVPSIYQMTRGALILFVGLFSVVFLKRRLWVYQWFALVTAVLGVAVVGLAGAVYMDHKAIPDAESLIREAVEVIATTAKSPTALRTIVGVLLIAGAQIFTAFQFVLEEYILENYALEPLKVVGYEGLFGFTFTFLFMIIMHLAVGRTAAGRYGYFDMVEGWREITQYRSLGVASILIMISIGAFNFFGLSVTRTVSATSRSTIDTCRTLFIWIVSLFLGWETFKWLQVVGFVLLVYGTFLFNGLARPPLKSCVIHEREVDLLPEEPIEHA